VKGRKNRTRIVALVLIIVFFLFAVLSVFQSFPPTSSVTPTAKDPVKPEDPVKPDSVDPKPAEPKLKLVSFSEKGEAVAKPLNAFAFTITYKSPEGSLEKNEVSVNVDVVLCQGIWDALPEEKDNKPDSEECLVVYGSGWELALFGVQLTSELAEQIANASIIETEDEAARLPGSIKVPANTIIGTLGSRPLTNDWGEGVDAVILVGVYPEAINLLDSIVISIVQSLSY